jgi:hypothetical protein
MRSLGPCGTTGWAKFSQNSWHNATPGTPRAHYILWCTKEYVVYVCCTSQRERFDLVIKRRKDFFIICLFWPTQEETNQPTNTKKKNIIINWLAASAKLNYCYFSFERKIYIRSVKSYGKSVFDVTCGNTCFSNSEEMKCMEQTKYEEKKTSIKQTCVY